MMQQEFSMMMVVNRSVQSALAALFVLTRWDRWGRWCAGLACLCLLVLGMQGRAWAHPHVFVENSVEMVFDGQGLTGFKVRWVFDAMSSSQYLVDLDTNGDGDLTKAEWQAQRDDIAGFLGEEHFFLYVLVNGKKADIPHIRDFWATMEDGALVYTFFAPLQVAAGNASVLLSIYDPTYYTDFQVYESDMHFTGAPAALVHSLDDAPELAFYNGQIIPLALRMQF